MRFLSPIIAFVLGLVALGLGIGQLAGWTPQQTQTVSSDVAEEAPLTIVTQGVVNPDQGRETLTVEAEGEYTIALARMADIEAWVGDAAHTRLTGVEEGPEGPEISTEHVDGETTVPDPAGSDLWAATETAEGPLDYRWSAPDSSGDWALLLFADGEAPAPSAVSTEVQEQPNQTLGVVLLVGGAVLILLGLWLFYRALGSRRRTRDQDLAAAAYDPAEDPAAEEPAVNTEKKPRRWWRNGSVATAAAVAVALSPAAGLSDGPLGPYGTTGEDGEADQPAGQDDGAADRPEPEDAEDGDGDIDVEDGMSSEGYSVLLQTQLERILADVAGVVEAGDEQLDAEALTPRVSGNALESRELAYRNNELADVSLPDPVGTEVQAAAVTAETEFPRRAVVITEHEQAEVPSILVLEQQTARENYQLVETAPMVPGTEFPAVSAEQGGVQQLEPEDETAQVSPTNAVEGLAGYFADPDHDFGGSVAQSTFIENLHDYHASLQEAAEQTEISFPPAEIGEDLHALELPDGSVVAAGSFDLNMLMSPTTGGSEIFLEDGTLVSELAETTSTTSPTRITNRETVVVHIPAEEDQQLALIGVNDIVNEVDVETGGASAESDGA